MDDQPEPAERTALYRCFGSGEDLLYVGITKSVGMRWQKHLSASAWWSQVKRQTIDWYDSRPAAESAERAAIRSEHPRYNRYRYDSVITPSRSTDALGVAREESAGTRTCLDMRQPCRRGMYGCFGESDLGYPCLLTAAASRG